MVLDQAANFVRGNTDASVASGDTTISVNNAYIFPDPANGEYNLVLWDADNHPRPDQDSNVEIVRLTGRDTTNDNLTVTRAQEGTSDVSHPSGSALQMSPTAAMFSDIDSTFGNFWDSSNSELTVDVNNTSVETERLTNGAFALVNSEENVLVPSFESLDPYTINQSVSIEGDGVRCIAFNETDRVRFFRNPSNNVNGRLIFPPTYDNKIAYSCRVGFELHTDRRDGWGVGRPEADKSGSKSIGFETNGTDIVAVTDNGSNQTRKTIGSYALGDAVNSRFIFVPNDRVEFYFDGAKQTEITTNLPTGDFEVGIPHMNSCINDNTNDDPLRHWVGPLMFGWENDS